MGDDGPRTIVIGIDGAGFDLLDPWLSDGELPNLAGVLEEGVAGPLESVLPPVTSPNWKCYATGKNPGKIGIFWWRNVDTADGRTYLPRERYHHNDEFWELLGEREPVGVIGVPTTYPPKQVDAFLVAGAPMARETGFAHPTSLERHLKRRFDYRITPRYRTEEGPERAYREWLDLIDLRFRVAKHLLGRYDLSLLQVTTFYINQFHHHLWDDEWTLHAWRRIDEHVGDLRSAGRNLVLMSDHGHNEIRSVFRINRWLEREGYLTWDRSVSRRLYRLGITTDRLNQLLVKLDRSTPGANPSDVIGRLAPRWLLRHLPNDQGEVGSRKATNVDWGRSDALATAQGPVYLNAERGTRRYERLHGELTEKLSALTDEQGRPVARAVRDGTELYTGEYVAEAPDIVVDQAPGVHIREHVGEKPVFGETDDVWAGVNRREGLFAAVGPDFAAGTVEDLSILDLAPTLLALHDVEPPADMDGHVRGAVLSADPDVEQPAAD